MTPLWCKPSRALETLHQSRRQRISVVHFETSETMHQGASESMRHWWTLEMSGHEDKPQSDQQVSSEDAWLECTCARSSSCELHSFRMPVHECQAD